MLWALREVRDVSGILVHEWLARHGGSENVFEVLSGVFPDAERFCLWNDSDGRFENVHETVLARTPLRRSKAAALPFMPAVWRHLPARDADWVLTSSHLFAHHARFAGPARHAPKLVYAHTPARYVWTPELDGRGSGLAARAASALLKPIDRKRAAADGKDRRPGFDHQHGERLQQCGRTRIDRG